LRPLKKRSTLPQTKPLKWPKPLLMLPKQPKPNSRKRLKLLKPNSLLKPKLLPRPKPPLKPKLLKLPPPSKLQRLPPQRKRLELSKKLLKALLTPSKKRWNPLLPTNLPN
jgi:hypothetical protein